MKLGPTQHYSARRFSELPFWVKWKLRPWEKLTSRLLTADGTIIPKEKRTAWEKILIHFWMWGY